MSRIAERHKAEMELYRQTKAYYDAIRRPWLEWTTFVLALAGSVAVSLRRFGIGITDYEHEGQWLTLYYWISLALFCVLDAAVARARHPLPISFGPLNPSRIYEKFATQERAWQLLLVLMLPVTARLVVAVMLAIHPT
jgi:hypothetical protein